MAPLAPFLISAALGCMVIGCSPTPKHLELVNVADGELKTQKGICYWNGSVFSGSFYELNIKGDTIGIFSYRNGKEDDVWKQFYENHQLKATRMFSRGKKTGEYKGWWENGKTKFIYHFENNEYEGICQEWSPDGKLLREANYESGHEAGPQKVWYSNGKIKSNYVVIDGRRYGLLGTKHCINVSDSVFNF